jgi:predicted transcriptional regulator of viral defense system
MPGKVYNALVDVALDQYGFVTPADAREIDVDPHRLIEMARRGVIERVDHGLYRVPVVARTGLDQLMQATLWPRKQGVLSHETALDLHDLCDVNPAKVHITVPTAYRITRRVPDVYAIHHRDLAAGHVTRHEGIPLVTPARAILDGIETHLRGGLIEQAIETAQRRGLLRPADFELVQQRRKAA